MYRFPRPAYQIHGTNKPRTQRFRVNGEPSLTSLEEPALASSASDAMILAVTCHARSRVVSRRNSSVASSAHRLTSHQQRSPRSSSNPVRDFQHDGGESRQYYDGEIDTCVVHKARAASTNARFGQQQGSTFCAVHTVGGQPPPPRQLSNVHLIAAPGGGIVFQVAAETRHPFFTVSPYVLLLRLTSLIYAT